jgi:hypothetical protein
MSKLVNWASGARGHDKRKKPKASDRSLTALCVMCLDLEKNTAFTPCGHFGFDVEFGGLFVFYVWHRVARLSFDKWQTATDKKHEFYLFNGATYKSGQKDAFGSKGREFIFDDGWNSKLQCKKSDGGCWHLRYGHEAPVGGLLEARWNRLQDEDGGRVAVALDDCPEVSTRECKAPLPPK